MTSILKTNAIEPEGATTNMVVGESGQNTVISNNDLRANVLQDAGGNALFTSNGSGVLSGVNSGFGSSMVLLSTSTTAGAASIEFTSGINTTYKEYVFKFYKVAPITNAQHIYMLTSTDGGSSYGVTTTSTYFDAHQHIIWDTTTALEYGASRDLAQSTSPQQIGATVAMSTQSAGGNNTPGANLAGELILYNPASTTYVKHWACKTTWNQHLAAAYNSFIAGYVNTTSAVNAIKFYAASGNIEGTIKMWGVK